MKDVTDIFSQAIAISEGYDAKALSKKLETLPNIWCYMEYDSCDRWYLIGRTNGKQLLEIYGYFSRYYPAALLMERCPENVSAILHTNKVLMTAFEEPLSCDEKILQQYLPGCKVFDESFLESCDYSFDDERFDLVLHKLETGSQSYVDAGHFLFEDLYRR